MPTCATGLPGLAPFRLWQNWLRRRLLNSVWDNLALPQVIEKIPSLVVRCFPCQSPNAVYNAERTKFSLLTVPSQASVVVPATAAPNGKKTIAVTPNRRNRTTLSLVLPGGVSERSIWDCLQAAFDEGRGAAFVSALTHETGQRAGEILAKVNHAMMGAVMQARDELFYPYCRGYFVCARQQSTA